MAKHAFLIIAHHQFELLEKLLLLLDHQDNDIYIHISKSVKNFDFHYFERLPQKSNIYFTERISVVWGGSSQIETELVLLKKATEKKYDYYHLLSGVDLPLKPMKYIHDFFDKNKGKEFIQTVRNGRVTNSEVLNRVRVYHFFQNIVGRKNSLLRFVKRVLVKIQELLHINRWGKDINNIGFGANWFSITHEFACHVVSQTDFILKRFKYTLCADEIFIQTVLNKSDFRNNVYVYDGYNPTGYLNIMRHIDWQRGNPYVFKNDDFDDLISSPYLFARKFDLNVDKEIVERIFQYVSSK